MTSTKPHDDQQPMEDDVLRRMLSTPHKPHVPKPKPKKKKAKKPAK
jgi:hypothetical protein